MILAHLFGNALLLWLSYYWLGIGESSALSVVWSALVAIAIACSTCWLHGAAFAYFAPPERRLRLAFRAALLNLPALLLAALAIAGIYLLLARLDEWSARPAFRIASYLTLTLRSPVKPASVLRVFIVALWLVKWIVVPALLLPMVSGVASRGWPGFRDIGARLRDWLYWVLAPVLSLLAFWVPFQLYAWVPRTGSFAMEMISFLLRISAGYLLFVAGWMALVFVTSAGTPRLTHSKTVASP
jgi:hypothetical protein